MPPWRSERPGEDHADARIGRFARVSPGTRETAPSPWRSERLARPSTDECSSSLASATSHLVVTLGRAEKQRSRGRHGVCSETVRCGKPSLSQPDFAQYRNVCSAVDESRGADA